MRPSAPFAVHAACLRGVEALPVTVEVSMSGGIPGITIVGMADSSVLEARGRIRCALRSAGFEVPRANITVNLAPADMRKTGSGFDLPIAVAILAISNQIPRRGLDDCLFVGEIGLSGDVNPVRGEVAYQLLARSSGLRLIGAKAGPHVSLDGVEHLGIADISGMRHGVERAASALGFAAESVAPDPDVDFSDVIGQEAAKRALTIAAAGGLGVLMVGSPGSGKTMLARRLTTILPTIQEDERQEALCVHSVCGERIDGLLAGRRPFRSPHHSISAAGLIGGGRPVRPGEISLAHGGVLFLDELAEFSSYVLQTLRQPLEAGEVRIVRADGCYLFPARFQLVAASNPCPCGYLGDRDVACTCSEGAIARYTAKLSGPLADRIDIAVDVARPDPEAIVRGEEGRTSAEMSSDVERARAFREERERDRGGDARGPTTTLEGAVGSFGVSGEGVESLLKIAQSLRLTGRGIVRVCRIARAIADLELSEWVLPRHLLEASLFRGRGVDDGG